jgi:outer membrane protein
MKKQIVLIACILLIGNVVMAQTAGPKIGYINSVTLLNGMPEKMKADTTLAKYAKSFEDQYTAMTREYQTKAQQYQAGGAKMTEAAREVKGKELQDLQNRIEGFQQSAQEKIQQKKGDIWDPIAKKLNAAIVAVAKEKHYDFIFDAANGSMVYQKEEFDITSQVKGKWGK